MQKVIKWARKILSKWNVRLKRWIWIFSVSIDHNITVNVIKGDRIVEKKELKLPKQVKNVIKCKNPRCVTSIEQELDQIFILADEEKEVYRCKYCEEKYTNPNRRQIKVM